MNIKHIFIILSLIMPLSFAQASLFEQGDNLFDNAGENVEGVVKGITLGEPVKLKIENNDKDKEIIVVGLCNDYRESRNDMLIKDHVMQAARESMAKGKKIKLIYSGLFNTCVNRVELIN